ncbi:MAG: glycoside hydrolase family 2 protein [Treponema sp.]|nr:glycoside hydrolase family 2 protein [Treponema sp.]
MTKFSLNGSWNLSANDINTKANIPGDFHTALMENGYIKDPFYGFNEKDQLWVGQSDWILERTFDYKKRENYKSILNITFADTFFTLFINNKEVGKGNNTFALYRFDISDFLIDGKNTIKFLFESPEKRSMEIARKLPYPVPYMKYDVFSPDRNMARKCQCNGGWDWGPCVMVSGIYQDIYIEEVADGLFNNPLITYSHKNDEWTAHITISFDSFFDITKEFKISISADDFPTVEKKINQKIIKGKNSFKVDLKVKNPSLWKTSGELKEAGLEENTIYKLKIWTEDSFGQEKQITKNIVFNSLKAISKVDKIDGKEGRSIYFENNGRKIFAKGSNWIPVDCFPSRFTYQRYYDLLKSTVDANQNCLRVWGGGYYEFEDFYDICDRLGIIIWQDCMFACSLYPVTQDFINQVEEELDYQIPRLQSHACIGLWCGNNENYGAMNWFPESNKNRVRYLVDYDRLYNGVIGKKIKEIDPSRIYWPSSPCAGPDDYADNWHEDIKGDMHYWSVWHERKDKEAYMSIKPRFVSEFGYESFPSLNCINSFAEKKDWNFTSKLMEYHQRSPSGNSIILENFSRYFSFPNGFENMVYLSQVQQAIAIKTAVDYWRSLKPRCMGALVWQLNDIWPGPSWSSLEYSGKWKLLQYEEKKFFENLYMPLYIKDGILYCNITNDLSKDVKAEISIRFLSFADGKDLSKEIKLSCQLAADKTENIYSQKVSKEDAGNYFIYACMKAKDSSGKEYFVDNTIFPEVYKHCNIEKAQIKCNVSKKAAKSFEIRLSTDKPAFFVSLDTLKNLGRFSDNLLNLLAEKEKVITFTSNEELSLEEFKADLRIYDLASSSLEK